MVYGMDVAREKQRAKQIVFNSEGSTELLGRAPQPMSELDLAELKLQQGDTDAAATLAQKVLDSKTGDLGEAHFLMARIESREGLMDDATASFEQTLTLSTDAHTSAWAHIYLGRIYDIQQKRDQALAEYHAALALDDSAAQKAAQAGIDHAFTVPKREQDDNDVPLDPTGKAQKDAYRPEPSQSPVPQQ